MNRTTRSGKTVWIVLGIVVAVLAVCGGVIGFGLFGAVKVIQKAQSEAIAFSTDSLNAIAKPWKASELWNRADEEYKKATPQDATEKWIASREEQLGNLKSEEPFKATSTNVSSNNGVSTTTVECDTTAHFEKGDAEVKMTVVGRDSKWFILNFDIKSSQAAASATPSPSEESSPESASPSQ